MEYACSVWSLISHKKEYKYEILKQYKEWWSSLVAKNHYSITSIVLQLTIYNT